MSAADLGLFTQALDPPMVVVTAAVDGERGGCLVGFHSQASIEPTRYVVWLSELNHTHEIARRAELFVVHLLSSEDHEIARLFGGVTGDDTDKLARCRWHEGDNGEVILDDLPHRFTGRPVERIGGVGDHTGVVLEPIAVDVGPVRGWQPLRYDDVRDVHAGHPPGDR